MNGEVKTPALGTRQQQKQKTREALLAAARKVIAQRGLAKTTTREVAQEARVAAGTFFVHFADVDALVEALLDAHIAAALARALDTLPRRGNLVRRLLHVCTALIESYDAEPDLAREYLAASLFRSRPGGPTEARLLEFQAWVTGQIAEAAPAVDAQVTFAMFFWTYFGCLVAGLRGQLRRKEQLGLLEAALKRIFTAPAAGARARAR